MKKILFLLYLVGGISFFVQANDLPKDALYDAIMKDAANEIIFASQAGIDLDSCRCGKPGLVWAVLFRKAEAAEALLKCGADSNVTYLDKSMVAYAVEVSDWELACVLAKYGADKVGYEDKINSYLDNELQEAIRQDQPERIYRFGYLGANVRDSKYVDQVIEQKNHKSLRVLIELGAKVNKPYTDLLCKALNNDDIETASILVENGAGIFERKIGSKHSHEHTVLSNIIFRIGHNGVPLETGIRFIDLLINRGYELNGDDFSSNALRLTLSDMFRLQSETGSELLEFFIKKGVDVNKEIDTSDWLIKDLSGGTYTTPLFMTIKATSGTRKAEAISAIKLLLRSGADINLEAFPCEQYISDFPKKAMRPLFYAVKLGCSQQVIDLLMENGACL